VADPKRSEYDPGPTDPRTRPEYEGDSFDGLEPESEHDHDHDR
jgi:hypothetical protein